MAAIAAGVTAAPMVAPETSIARSVSAFGMSTPQPVSPHNVTAMAEPESQAAGIPRT